jgi:Phage capsid family
MWQRRSMTTLSDINRAAAAASIHREASDLVTIARAMMVARSQSPQAMRVVMHNWVNEAPVGTWMPSTRALKVVKAAVDAGGTAAGTWGSDLSDPDYTAAITAFLGSLRNVGVFDRMIADGAMMSVPLRSRYAIASGGLTASTISAGSIKPISSATFTSDTNTERKVVCAIVCTNEFLRIGGQAASNVLDAELRGAVAYETDLRFLTDITASATPKSATGINSFSVRRDLGTAMAAMSSSSRSKFYVVMQPAMAKSLATLSNADGFATFPEMTPMGGSICGCTVLVTDACPSAEMIVIDASQIIAAQGDISMRVVTHGDVQLSSTPDSPVGTSTVAVSLFQTNSQALVCERYFAASLLGSTAVQVISSAAYGDSPAPP